MIKLKNVSVKYDGFTAIENVSFEIEKGDWFCITGENGCGKSTIIKAIAGIEKVSSGEIVREETGGVGYVSQLSAVQNDFPAGVFEIVLSGHIKKAGLFYTASDRRNAIEKLKTMGVENLKNACFRELSGGQRQRVLIARALCAGENLLILDEPMTGLDEESEITLYQTLKNLNDKGVTVLMVSHDFKNVIKYANKILHIEKGGCFVGSCSEFIKGRSKANDRGYFGNI